MDAQDTGVRPFSPLRVSAIAMTILGGLGFIAFAVLWLVAARRMEGETSLTMVGAERALAVFRTQAWVLGGCGVAALVGAFLVIRGRHWVGGGIALLAAALAVFLTPKFVPVVLTKGVVLLGGVLALFARPPERPRDPRDPGL